MFENLVNSNRNPAKHIWQRFSLRDIGQDQLHLEVMRLSIDNLDKWYNPRVIVRNDLSKPTEMAILRELIEDNKTNFEWLKSMLEYAGLPGEKGRIQVRMDAYGLTVHKQKERLSFLCRGKTGKKQTDYKPQAVKPIEVKSAKFFDEPKEVQA